MELELRDPSTSAFITQTEDFKTTISIKGGPAWKVFFIDTLHIRASKDQVPVFSEQSTKADLSSYFSEQETQIHIHIYRLRESRT
jgi:hypothetical protein